MAPLERQKPFHFLNTHDGKQKNVSTKVTYAAPSTVSEVLFWPSLTVVFLVDNASSVQVDVVATFLSNRAHEIK